MSFRLVISRQKKLFFKPYKIGLEHLFSDLKIMFISRLYMDIHIQHSRVYSWSS